MLLQEVSGQLAARSSWPGEKESAEFRWQTKCISIEWIELLNIKGT